MQQAFDNVMKWRRIRQWEEMARVHQELGFWMEQLALRQWEDRYEYLYECHYSYWGKVLDSIRRPEPKPRKPRRSKPKPLSVQRIESEIGMGFLEQCERNTRAMEHVHRRIDRRRVDHWRESGSSFDDIVRAMEDG